ncbi:hypothetical protein [Arthrobacter mobilis]|uniref:Uncharacterized protein n=1 Tax=Arthrobacter mobilis TaxID=2724944 RepID=A0A7X6HEN8_9MICC|nr:hypothetical protein [Arthrobacter mobilis]NKX54287.1 hypothetical protein [Arthrobacter mobilis]
MEFTGDYFAAAATAGTDGGRVPVRVYRGAAGLNAIQLGEALDNPELLEGNWLLLRTLPAASDIAGSLAADFAITCTPGESWDVGQWRIVQLQDFRLEPGDQGG